MTGGRSGVLQSRQCLVMPQSLNQIPNAMASKADVLAMPVNIFRTFTESGDAPVPELLIPTQAAPIQHNAENAMSAYAIFRVMIWFPVYY